MIKTEYIRQLSENGLIRLGQLHNQLAANLITKENAAKELQDILLKEIISLGN